MLHLPLCSRSRSAATLALAATAATGLAGTSAGQCELDTLLSPTPDVADAANTPPVTASYIALHTKAFVSDRIVDVQRPGPFGDNRRIHHHLANTIYGRQFIHGFEITLTVTHITQRMTGKKLRQHGEPVTNPRVVFHRAGTQRIELRIDGKVLL